MKKPAKISRFQKAGTMLSLLLLCSTILASCTPNNPSNRFNFKETRISYYEFVHENPACLEYCSAEYIVFSNNLIFSKIKDRNGEELMIGHIPESEAKVLLELATQAIGNRNNDGTDCTTCDLYHLFYGDSRRTQAFTILRKDSPAFIEQLKEATENALENQQKPEQFFLQLVYTKKDEDSIDYHFFIDGTVLYEVFGKRNGELKSSAVYTITDQEVQDLRDLIGPGVYSSEDNLMDCPKIGFDYGYLFIKDEDEEDIIWTCGTGQSPADMLFNTLFEKTGEK